MTNVDGSAVTPVCDTSSSVSAVRRPSVEGSVPFRGDVCSDSDLAQGQHGEQHVQRSLKQLTTHVHANTRRHSSGVQQVCQRADC